MINLYIRITVLLADYLDSQKTFSDHDKMINEPVYLDEEEVKLIQLEYCCTTLDFKTEQVLRHQRIPYDKHCDNGNHNWAEHTRYLENGEILELGYATDTDTADINIPLSHVQLAHRDNKVEELIAEWISKMEPMPWKKQVGIMDGMQGHNLVTS
ncbi:hypothetical protein [Moritella sp. F3]|uniref:hypothetical protein n=1 Tax=Moritella sp. F3 TaxID=2718882 RepID=UPI0018E126D9|nr:hypothetical protein [Moritella sp. F3]GIC77104.1 hypothetical protein FMO001_18310 [Moritella sp. F1]GIC82223.1 hypothetical protein FMO003_25040 [Moritella sp. F3]